MDTQIQGKKKQLEIRDALEDEREAVQEVTLAAYQEYTTAISEPFWEGYRQHIIATLKEKGPIEHIVAVDNQSIVGSVLLYASAGDAYTGVAIDASAPEVRLLAVLPSARGQGIGKALMDECLRRAHHMGATTIGLHTMDMMHTAMDMYERMGFVHTPALDFHPAEGIVVKGYSRPLDSSR